MNSSGDGVPKNMDEESAKLEKSSDKSSEIAAITKLQPKNGLLIVKMYTPYRIFYEGYAKSVSALNETGAFDILPGHHNFISMLKPCDVGIIAPGQVVRNISISHGLMHVRGDKVIIFLDV